MPFPWVASLLPIDAFGSHVIWHEKKYRKELGKKTLTIFRAEIVQKSSFKKRLKIRRKLRELPRPLRSSKSICTVSNSTEEQLSTSFYVGDIRAFQSKCLNTKELHGFYDMHFRVSGLCGILLSCTICKHLHLDSYSFRTDHRSNQHVTSPFWWQLCG